jgi:hypothetical protein
MLPAGKRAGEITDRHSSRTAELRSSENLRLPDFDFQKLIRLCEELNSSYDQGNMYASAMLTRAILDHVPPLFGYKRRPRGRNTQPPRFTASTSPLRSSTREKRPMPAAALSPALPTGTQAVLWCDIATAVPRMFRPSCRHPSSRGSRCSEVKGGLRSVIKPI